MILGYNVFGYEWEGLVWDTPIPTEAIDTLRVFEGTYDGIYIDLDTDLESNQDKIEDWRIKTILNAEFKGNLDAGSISADGFRITHVQIVRSVLGSGEWETVSVHEYNDEYNVYSFVDRYVPNGLTYEYAICPIANEIVGERLVAEPIVVDYEGIMLTDSDNNFRLEFDTQLGEITYNNDMSVLKPINSPYPITTYGNSKYRSGSITTLPLSDNTLDGQGVNDLAEQVYRQKIINFLNNGKAKALRMDNGNIMLIQTGNVKVNHKEGNLVGLASISFDYAEMGEMNFQNQLDNGLVSGSHLSKNTFDEVGGVVRG